MGQVMKSSNDHEGMMSEINVTPLVDVMLVLLVVFIVTAPLLVPQSLKINLPETERLTSSSSVSLAIEKTRLIIQADGKLVFDDKPVNDKELALLLRAKAIEPSFQLFVESDEAVKYGRVAQVMAIAKNAGIPRISFLTLPQTGTTQK
jgi:biopolymer transport protein ExbD